MQQKTVRFTAVLSIGAILVMAFLIISKGNQSQQKAADEFMQAAEKKMSSSQPVLPTTSNPHSKTNPHSSAQAMPRSQVTAGPKEDFLEVSPSSQWQLLDQEEGIASIKYQLTLEGNFYEMAVIRMNAGIPLNSVLDIWQQKAGLAPQPNIEFESFTTNADQSLQMTTLKGPHKTLFLAMHQGDKYTFFRLSGNNKIDGKVRKAFEGFLAGAKIVM